MRDDLRIIHRANGLVMLNHVDAAVLCGFALVEAQEMSCSELPVFHRRIWGEREGGECLAYSIREACWLKEPTPCATRVPAMRELADAAELLDLHDGQWRSLTATLRLWKCTHPDMSIALGAHCHVHSDLVQLMLRAPEIEVLEVLWPRRNSGKVDRRKMLWEHPRMKLRVGGADVGITQEEEKVVVVVVVVSSSSSSK